jgi:hypothetical protein
MSTSALGGSHPIVAIEKSNLPVEKKTAIREYWDNLHHRMGALAVGGAGAAAIAKSTAKEGGMLLRQDGVAALTGLSLALLEHTFGGLDVNVFGKSVPLDGVLAGAGALGVLAAPAFGLSELSPEFRTVSSTAVGILFYRKGTTHFQRSGIPGLNTSGNKGLKELAEKLGT